MIWKLFAVYGLIGLVVLGWATFVFLWGDPDPEEKES